MVRLNPRRVGCRSALTVVGIGAVLSLAACASGSAGSANLVPVAGGTLNVLRTSPFEGFELDKESLNSTYQISQSVLEPLIHADADGKTLQPGLASSWSFNPDHSVLTIKLDPKAVFGNGAPVTPSDVAFSVDTWKSGPNYGATYSVISSTKIVDEHTIDFQLAAPDTALPAFLSWATAGVVPKDFGGRPAADFWQKPIGAGPFAVSTWSADGKVVLDRNTHYYRGGRPYVDSVVSTYASDPNSISLQLQSGQADLADEILPVTAATLPKKDVHDSTRHLTDVLLMNTKDPALADVSLRQAIGYAIDYASITGSALKGYAVAPTGPLPTNIANWAPPSHPYFGHDQAKAKELLARTPHVPTTLSMAYPNDPSSSLIAQIVQQNLKDLGIDVTLQAADFASNYATISGGKYQFGLFSYNAISPDISDPVVYLAATTTMFTGFPVDAVNAAVGDYSATDDSNAKLAAVTKIQDMLSDGAPFIALSHRSELEGQRAAVHAVELTPWGTYDLASAWKNK